MEDEYDPPISTSSPTNSTSSSAKDASTANAAANALGDANAERENTAQNEKAIVESVRKFIVHSSPPLLNILPTLVTKALNSEDDEEALRLFATDPQCVTLVVEKRIIRNTAADLADTLQGEIDNELITFNIGPKPLSNSALESEASNTERPKSTVVSSVVFIKAVQMIDITQTLSSQLFVCSLRSPSVFDTLLTLIRHLFLPYTRTLTTANLDEEEKKTAAAAGNEGRDAADSALYRGVNRKLGELEVELLRFQQTVDIPLINLDVHEKIAEFVKRQREAGKALRVEDMGDLASDPNFLNEIQRGLNEWKRSILRVTRLNRDVSSGTTLNEVNFWLAMERAVIHIYEQKDSIPVDFTFQILKQNKRFLATTGFMQDVGLSEEGKDRDRVIRYASFLRDFPIKRLLSASDLTEMIRALEVVFTHMKQIRRLDYPLSRAIALMHALSRDVVAVIQTILNSRRLMALNYEEFSALTRNAEDLFVTWQTRIGEFSELVRQVYKKKQNESISGLSEPYTELNDLRTRISELRRIRKEHEELRAVISETLENDQYVRNNAVDAISSAYSALRDVDILNITPDGRDMFAAALQAYSARIDRVEADLESKIRQLLDAAKDDANEMFRVCAKFNALFVRPRIQSAIREYQEQLIAVVKKDIVALEVKFNSKQAKTEARRVSKLHDLPPVAGSIIWAKQIERQLNTYMTRVENVLGRQWHHHVEGRQLKRDTDDFRAKLKPARLYQAWLLDKQENITSLQIKGPIFRVINSGKSLALVVNFDRQLVTLFKEVRSLAKLDLKIPFDVITCADEARQNYPFAMRLEEVIRIYSRTCARLDANPTLLALASGMKRSFQDSISKGISLQWLDTQVKSYVDSLGTQAVDFQDQVEELVSWVDSAQGYLQKLENCRPDQAVFKSIIDDLQRVIDHLDKRSYSNLQEYARQLDGAVEKILVKRLQVFVDAFIRALDVNGQNDNEDRQDGNWDENEQSASAKSHHDNPADFMTDQQYAQTMFPDLLKHEILIRNQVLCVEPPLERARVSLHRALYQWLSMVCDLPRLRMNDVMISSIKAGKGDVSDQDSTYRGALNKLDVNVLCRCLDAMEDKLVSADSYVNTWLSYQALWDMEMESIVKMLGTDLTLWEKLLVDMKRARATFDTNEKQRRFGPILIEFSGVQTKVNNKYDQWHKSVLTRFGNLLGELMTQLYSELRQAREQLEKHTFDLASTSDIVDSVTLLQALKKKSEKWSSDLEKQKSVEKLLQRQRFNFPSDWLFADRLEGEWHAFEQILNRKLSKMSDEAPAIQAKLGAEDVSIDTRIKEFASEWKKHRPVSGELNHKEVEAMLNVSDVTLGRLENDVNRLNAAKRALDMQVKDEYRLQPIREELSGLKEVWSHLGVCWNELDTIGDRPFRDIKPSDIRKQLTKLQSDVQKLPNAMRTYEAYEHLRTVVRNYLSMNGSLVELHSGVLRVKHEKQLLKELHINVPWSELTVGMLWRTDLKAHSKAIQSILAQAQGESALEEFLAELREQWDSTRFELVDYKGKCSLIRNWDPLFAVLTERLSDLNGMKQSPFFKSFERDALQWESKLNIAQSILDVFIDVQRRWVYLEGIFSNSLDVQNQLAQQFKRFKTFDREFVRLMRDIAKEPALEQWVKEERQLQRELESYAETLNSIQKALTEYLEKQRAAFPRFYFVGDEDLLEMIGNARTPVKLLRHLSKMFAGIESLVVSEDQSTILSMVSREGETVPFKQSITINEQSTVHSWLTAVQYQMRHTLASLLEESITSMKQWDTSASKNDVGVFSKLFFEWVDRSPAQIVLLSQQVLFTNQIESALTNKDANAKLNGLSSTLKQVELTLEILSESILNSNLSPDIRKKYEQLITECVHQRDTVRRLIDQRVASETAFEWLGQMRFYFNPVQNQQQSAKKSGNDLTALTESIASGDPPELRVLQVRVSRASFFYGFEYLGVAERLVQTPLTDTVYMTLCEALHMRLGGSPIGPAGTGKTESVKALGHQLGRMVLVFNCDEQFDFTAMGRIFVGLCQCGAWGCFDEFNRLEERILSAVSQQILTIQVGLRENRDNIQMLGKSVRLDSRVGLFVTLNPGYLGRSNLPDNLKQLFREVAMIQPDKLFIAQVMLYSQGFKTAEALSGKVVMLFSLCNDQLSTQSHYDFGLRALKSVLRSAGGLKRESLLQAAREEERKSKEAEDDTSISKSHDSKATNFEDEQAILVRSIYATIVPKLVASDVSLFSTLVRAVFPNSELALKVSDELKDAIYNVINELHYVNTPLWVEKIFQLYEINSIHHGVIMVGPTGTGKMAAWNVLRTALERVEGTKISTYVLDPKSISKAELYGSMDDTTMEYTDGVFTGILRRIIDNVRGEMSRRHWIIFDGDVDPEWAENLNSVLDDNKLLTLPNGERLAIPPNVRILFEVHTLAYATLATVSRCGMVWFSEGTVPAASVIRNMLSVLKYEPFTHASLKPTVYSRWKHVHERCISLIEKYIGINSIAKLANTGKSAGSAENTMALLKDTTDSTSSFIILALEWVSAQSHIMTFDHCRALMSLFSLLKGAIAKIIDYDDNHYDFPLSDKQLETYLSRYLVFAIIWSFGGSLSLENRLKFCSELINLVPSTISLPDVKSHSLLDYEVRTDTQEWELWDIRVDSLELDPHKVVRADVVIDTVDTARHTDVIGQWLSDHRPLILVGPPGSGKSMTLTSVLRALPEFELVTLNFSSSTTPKLLLDSLAHYCKIERTPNGLVMHPANPNKWLVLFCDEINLPAADKYSTQHVITWIRQVAERGGFWRASDISFIRMERIQIIGACNPPTDAGRVPMSPRFLRHCPLLFVDFPAVPSLKQIYGTFNRALLKLMPPLRAYADALTDAMIEVYSRSQKRFTADIQPHYIYSPRELSRWVRAMYEAIKPAADNGIAWSIEVLVRLWAHEALRLFQDRLVDVPERTWTDETVDTVARTYFPNCDTSAALTRPILFSNWLNKHYVSVSQDSLREHVKTRLKVFYEEELDVKLVIFDEVLDHILRIDRVLRQPLGHLLLVGSSGAGKTILSKFVAWMNGMSVFQIKVHKYYTAKDFDKDLRSVLIRAGCKGEPICFIFDESNVLSTAFLERMNALLAGGEVPGLFEGQDYNALILEIKDCARRDNILLDSEEELYRHFTTQVQRKLHVVFTMNPANEDFDNRSATSPALFNRCVIDWFGEWSPLALYQVGYEFTKNMDLGDGIIIDEHDTHALELETERLSSQRTAAGNNAFGSIRAGTTERDAVVRTLVFVHESVTRANKVLADSQHGRSAYVTPRHYLDFIKHYSGLFDEKRSALEDQQRHLNTGLRKLQETAEEVMHLQQALQEKEVTLRANEKLANDKLDQMMIDKREAESKRDISVKIAADIKQQAEMIAQRQVKVESDLEEARPALLEAEAAVRNIKKPDLDQVSRFPNPPAPVKLALEAVILMLGENAKSWEDIRKVLRRADFIKSVINYEMELCTPKVRQEILTKYLPDPNFAYEVVYNASKACGPLVKWVASTIHFTEIKDSVAPLEAEMRTLEATRNEMQAKADELAVLQAELNTRIEQYKVEYSALIGEVERIKGEMSSVQIKVDRSTALLTNLSSERERWEADSASFQSQMSTLVGDCLLAAAFLSYSGYFNQTYRSALIETWMEKLKLNHVNFKSDLSLIEYLSNPGQRLEWQAASLPADDLCIENAIMIERFNRYPLIVDPSGQATEFLLKHFHERKIMRTSFLDDAFLKNLESALRFGNALLVEDVESIDPILNSVLNREITKTAGRVMITLGDKEIDFSPSFTIFLLTRDPSCHFTPDLCSRVTLVNFTVTHSSLRNQCLNKILQAERPDVNEKRSNLLKLQGEFRFQLRSLEDSLLDALNKVKGNILDDETVLTKLETLKKQAAEVTERMAESEQVMEEVSNIGNLYRPFAQSASSLYFSLENLANVHYLYQFSLPSFLRIVDGILFPTNASSGANAKNTGDLVQRLNSLTRQLFVLTYTRVSRGLLNEHHTAFAMRICQIALDESGLFSNQQLDSSELEFFMKGTVPTLLKSAHGRQLSVTSADSIANIPATVPINLANRSLLAELVRIPAFSKLGPHIASHIDEWTTYITAPVDVAQEENTDNDGASDKESNDHVHTLKLPNGWEQSASANAPAFVHRFREILVAKCIRADRVPSLSLAFIQTLFATDLNPNLQFNLRTIFVDEGDAAVPIVIVSKPGFDASGKVDTLAAELNLGSNYVSLAMGSPEGYDQADAAISSAVKKGSWVLLKNVHLSPHWLNALEKRLRRFTYHPNFRLIMTMELHPNVPASLLRLSNKLIFEPPVGVKAALRRMFGSISPSRVNRAPAERSRLYFLLSWLHAVVIERLRYVPVGWSKGFEFSETDAFCTMDAIDEWIDKVTQGRLNISPASIPWDALRTTIQKVMYGGRIDNEFDDKRLNAFVSRLFTPESYDVEFPLCSAVDDDGNYTPLLRIPDSRTYEGFMKWIEQLEDNSTPQLLGLPGNADTILLRQQAINISQTLILLQDSEHEAETLDGRLNLLQLTSEESSISDSTSVDGVVQPSWAPALLATVTEWLSKLPTPATFSSSNILTKLQSAAQQRELEDYFQNPMFRCIQREFVAFESLLAMIMDDLQLVRQVLANEMKANNRVRELLSVLRKAKLPKYWMSVYRTVPDVTAQAWMEDFARRLAQIQRLVASKPADYFSPIWLGGFASPEGFVAATRQYISSLNAWPLEQLSLHVHIEAPGAPTTTDSFLFSGVTLYCVQWETDSLTLKSDNALETTLPMVRFNWKLSNSSARANASSDAELSSVLLPVYYDVTRRALLFSVQLPCPTESQIPRTAFLERAACLGLWSESGFGHVAAANSKSK